MPPARVTWTAELTLGVPATWKIQIALGLPEIVMLLGTLTAVVHLYKPGVGVLPPILPASKFRKLGFDRPAALVQAVCISPTAVVSLLALVTRQGRGPAALNEYIVPVISVHLM